MNRLHVHGQDNYMSYCTYIECTEGMSCGGRCMQRETGRDPECLVGCAVRLPSPDGCVTWSSILFLLVEDSLLMHTCLRPLRAS